MDNRVATLKAAIDEMHTRVEAAESAQKLSDVRWSRLIGDWQQQLERWRASVEEATRPVGQLGMQLGQLRTEIIGHQAITVDLGRRLDDTAMALQRVESLTSAGREHVGRVEVGADALRRRLDETIAAVLRLEEAVTQRSIEARDQSTRLDTQVADSRAIQQQVVHLRGADEVAERSVLALQNELRIEGALRDEQVRAVGERLGEEITRQDSLRLSFSRLLAEQRRRTLVSVEREIRDLIEPGNEVDFGKPHDRSPARAPE